MGMGLELPRLNGGKNQSVKFDHFERGALIELSLEIFNKSWAYEQDTSLIGLFCVASSMLYAHHYHRQICHSEIQVRFVAQLPCDELSLAKLLT